MFKTYQTWTQPKILTNAELLRPKLFRAGQIWWCMVGQNIGVEIDGKQAKFLRPVLIIKKYGENSFFGIPTTSKEVGEKPYYLKVNAVEFSSTLLLSQGRSFDAARLVRRIDTVNARELERIRLALGRFLELVNKNAEPPFDGSDSTSC